MKVSVCIACYNAEYYIEDLLNALKKQTYDDFEVILVDDHSTDNTINIITNFIKNDVRFKLYVNTTNLNEPYVDSHNKSYEYASGDYLIRLDDDDIPEPDLIKTFVKFLDDHLEYDACNCDVKVFCSDFNNNYYEGSDIYENTKLNRLSIKEYENLANTDNYNKFCNSEIVFNDLCIANQCSCIRKEFLLRNNLKFKYKTIGDYLFWLDFVCRGGNSYKIHKQLLNYRIHTNNLSKSTYIFPNKLQELIAKNRWIILSKISIKDENIINSINVFKNTEEYFKNKEQ